MKDAAMKKFANWAAQTRALAPCLMTSKSGTGRSIPSTTYFSPAHTLKRRPSAPWFFCGVRTNASSPMVPLEVLDGTYAADVSAGGGRK
jgi:hypothetical protein